MHGDNPIRSRNKLAIGNLRRRSDNKKEDFDSQVPYGTDRKGDLENTRYGSLDTSKVPKYRPAGHGRLIGLDNRFKIYSTSRSSRRVDDASLDDSRKHPRSSLLDGDLRNAGTMEPGMIGKIQEDGLDHEADFIRFTTSARRKKRKPEAFEEAEGRRDTANMEYESSESRSSETASDHDADTTSSENAAFDLFKDHPDNKKQIELTRTVDKYPQDVQAWLALIAHQETFLLFSLQKSSRVLSESEKGTLANNRVDLYEQAMSRVVESRAKDQLILGLMNEGSKIWDSKTQLSRWSTAAQQTDSISVLYGYLDFLQTNTTLCSFNKCLEELVALLCRLHRIEKSKEREQNLIEFALRLTTFMRQAGYAERAMAIWQALLEYNIRRPLDLNVSDERGVFEEFWNSERLRLGEKGSTGWLSASHEEVETRIDASHPEISPPDVFGKWAATESLRQVSDIMPARMLDDTIEDDPFRVILFPDINDFLFRIESGDGRRLLLQLFLKFCNLPPMESNDTASLRRCSDPFLSDNWPLTVEDISSSNVRLPYYCKPTTTALFKIPKIWSSVASQRQSSSTVLLDFAENALDQLLEYVSENHRLAEYLIALKLQRDSMKAKKYAKSLLKKQVNTPIVYNAYAMVESSIGNQEAAHKVWSTTIAMSTSFGDKAQKEVVILWYHWIWDLVDSNNNERALQLLISLPAATKHDTNNTQATRSYSELDIAQARQHLHNQITTSLTKDDNDGILHWTGLLAILQYLLSDLDIFEILQTYKSTLISLQTDQHTDLRERLHQSQAALLDLHARRSRTGYKPTDLKSALHQSSNLFPENSYITTLYEHYAHRAGLIDRLRTIDLHTPDPSLSTSTFTPTPGPKRPSIARAVLNLTSELSRPSYGITPHNIRTSFITATSPHTPGHHSPLLQSAHLTWELSLLSDLSPEVNDPQPLSPATSKRLKDVYLACLRACPWVKDVYMIGFCHPVIRSVMGHEGLDGVYRAMLERGLRVRVDIEDLLDDIRDQRVM